MIWVQLAISAVFFVIGELMRPKPQFEDAQSVPFDQARLPSVNGQARIPVVWGRVRLTSSHIADIVEYKAQAIKKKIKTSIFSSKKVVTGFRYFLGMQLGLCKSNGDVVLKKIYHGQTEIWSGTAGYHADGIAITINLPDILGGPDQGGGIIGTFRFHSSGPAANTSSYLSGFRADLPAYRHFAYIVLENVEVGESPNLTDISFEVERYPNPLSINSGADNRVEGNDFDSELNPMSILVECFSDPDFGFNRASELSLSTFTSAGAVLAAEFNGMSLKWVNTQTIEKIIQQINKQVNGVLRFNPKTGLWEYKLLRDDYVFANLPIFNEDNIRTMEVFTRASWDETVNEVIIEYEQREFNEKPKPAIAHDRSNFIRQGRHKSATINYPGCYSTDLANNLASRDLRYMAFAFAKADFVVNREGWDLLPGDPIRLQWSDTLGIVDIVMRVGEIGFGDNNQTEISLTTMEDVFALALNLFASPPSGSGLTLNGPPTDILTRELFDVPYFMALSDEDTTTPGLQHKPMALALKPQNNSLNYKMYTRQGSDAFVSQNLGDYGPTGTLVAAMTEELGPDLVASLSIQNVSLANLISTTAVPAADIKSNKLNLAFIVTAGKEPELIGYENATVSGTNVTLTNVHRGMGDTLNTSHLLGDRVWFISGESINGPVTSVVQYSSTGVVDVKLTNTTFGAESAIGAAAILTETFRDRVNRPYPPQFWQINSIRYPSATFALDTAFTFSWRHSDRLTKPLRFQDDAGEAALETGNEYVLRIYNDATNILLRTIRPSGSLNTPAGTDTFTSATTYLYTLVKQQADGGPFATMRAEMWVEKSVTGVSPTKTLVDVIRVWKVVIPVSLVARGPIYQSYAAAGPTFAYPLNQFAPPHTGIGVSAGNATEVGNTGNSGPGPDGLSYNIYTLGTVGNNVVIPHASTTLLNSRCVHLMFKIAADAQGDRALIIKDDADGGTARSYAIVISGSGLLRGDLSSTNSPAQGGAPVLNFEDGKWHQLVWIKYSGEGNALFVDGNLVTEDGVSTTTAPPTNTADLRVGAALTGTQLGYAKAFFSNLAFWTTTDIPTVPELQSMFANALLPSYTRGRQILSYPGLRLFTRGNVGDIFNGSLFLDLSESTTGHVNSWTPLIGTDNIIGTTNTVPASGASQRAMDIEDDPGYRALYLVNGSNEVHIIAPPNHFNGGTNAGVGAREFTFITSIKPDAAPAQPVGLLYIGGNSEQVAQNVFSIRIETNGKIRVHMSLSSGNSRTWETTSVAIPTFGGIWYEIVVTNKATDGKKIYVNGVSWPITESTAGTPPASDDWINNRGADTASKSVYLTNSPLNSQRSKLEFGEWAYIENLALTAGQVVLNWLNIKRGFPTFADELLWSHPENMFQVLDYATTTDKRGAITGTATVTGTLPTDEEVGIPSDDYTKPARFSTTQRLRYTSAQFLASKGTGVLHDFTAMIVGMSQGSASGTHFANGPAGGASTNRNLDFYFNNTNARVDFRTSDATLGVGPTRSHFDSYCIFMREKTAGGNFHEYWDDVVRNSSAATATAYTGAACVEANIGSQGALTVPLNGQTHYAAAWASYISTRLIKKIQLRYRGFVGALLEIHSHINHSSPDSVAGWIFPLDDIQSLGFHENYVVNDPSLIQNLAKDATPTRERSSAVYGRTHATKYASASNQFAEGVCRLTVGPSVITWGGMFRCDSGTNAWAGFGASDVVDTDRYFMVGIIGLRAGIKFNLNDSTDRVETGSTVLTVGTWYHIVCVRTSNTLREIYLNGVLEATFTVSRDWTGVTGIDKTSINKIPGPNTLANGTYEMQFGMAKALTAAEVREIYAAHLQDGTWQATRALGATAFWPLSDSENPALKFHDRVNGAYNATGTGMTERAAGIIPNRPGNCVDFDGSGQVDTNWLGYPTGAAVRSFAVWLEAGFVGTVFSMGANTDAQALVVSIDGSGDVSINIRGAGNLRKYTASFDGAGVRHLCVVQTVNSLYDFKVYQDGVDQTGIGTAGTDTTLATVATLDLHLGKDITDIATADGDGRMAAFSVYATALSADQANQLYLAGSTKKQGVS